MSFETISEQEVFESAIAMINRATEEAPMTTDEVVRLRGLVFDCITPVYTRTDLQGARSNPLGMCKQLMTCKNKLKKIESDKLQEARISLIQDAPSSRRKELFINGVEESLLRGALRIELLLSLNGQSINLQEILVEVGKRLLANASEGKPSSRIASHAFYMVLFETMGLSNEEAIIENRQLQNLLKDSDEELFLKILIPGISDEDSHFIRTETALSYKAKRSQPENI